MCYPEVMSVLVHIGIARETYIARFRSGRTGVVRRCLPCVPTHNLYTDDVCLSGDGSAASWGGSCLNNGWGCEGGMVLL